MLHFLFYLSTDLLPFHSNIIISYEDLFLRKMKANKIHIKMCIPNNEIFEVLIGNFFESQINDIILFKNSVHQKYS